MNQFSNRHDSSCAGLFGYVLWIGLAAASFATVAAAQVTVVALGTVSGGVKSEVIVPVLLTPANTDTKVGSITADIGFDGNVVTFIRAEKGFLLDGVNGKFQAEVAPNPPDPAKSSVHFEVKTEGEPRKALRDGLVLSLIFKINEKAAPATMPLKFQKLAAATADTPSKPVEPLVPTPGSIEVLAPESVPYVGCFFFTH